MKNLLILLGFVFIFTGLLALPAGAINIDKYGSYGFGEGHDEGHGKDFRTDYLSGNDGKRNYSEEGSRWSHAGSGWEDGESIVLKMGSMVNNGHKYGAGVVNHNSNGILSSVPEPSILIMLGCGIAGLAFLSWRFRDDF